MIKKFQDFVSAFLVFLRMYLYGFHFSDNTQVDQSENRWGFFRLNYKNEVFALCDIDFKWSKDHFIFFHVSSNSTRKEWNEETMRLETPRVLQENNPILTSAISNMTKAFRSLGNALNSEERDDFKHKKHLNRPERTLERIYKMNEIASHDDTQMSNLTKYAREHKLFFADVFRAYKDHPDIRFGDTLLVFCEQVDHGHIVIDVN